MKLDSQFLQYRFIRRLEWSQQEDGRVVVSRPRFGESRAGRKLAAWLGISDYRIRLDEIGSLVWKQCDGNSSAAEIAQLLRDEFGDRIEPAEERLFTFLSQMSRSRMIDLHRQ